MDCFTYNAPDFFDFSRKLDDKEDVKMAERFFDVEHERHGSVPVETLADSIIDSEEPDFEYEFYTPLKKTPVKEQERSIIRRSLSVGDFPLFEAEEINYGYDDGIDVICPLMQKLQMSKSSRSTLNGPERKKSHGMTTRADVPKLDLRTRSISRGYFSIVPQNRHKYMSQDNLNVAKYVSMAEAINTYQLKTPKRFHSKAKSNESAKSNKLSSKPLSNTIPHSPALATKQRARPPTVISREEQELKDFEEAKKHQIKANPINTKILSGETQIKLNAATKKPPTKPEPFNITQVPHKKAPTSPSPPPYEFHAKPLPKNVLAPPKPIIKSALCTNPITPNLMKRHHRPEQSKNEPALADNGTKRKQQPLKPVATKPLPFSFEGRDKEIIKRKEKLLNEVMEEEKKAREFHARPLPKSIFKSPQAIKNCFTRNVKRQNSDGSLVKSNESIHDPTSFKAKPARVLQMEPFEPKKPHHKTTEFSEFSLNTERRAKEREEFEHKMKEKEEKIVQITREREEEMIQKEQDEIKKIRKQMEHKACPIRHYKEVPLVTSKKLTAPQSPRFSSKLKHKYNTLVHNKENLVNTSNMH